MLMTQKLVSMAPLPAAFFEHVMRQNGIENVRVVDINAASNEDIKREVSDADYIIGDFSFKNRITRELAFTAKRVKLVQQPSVGYQHIDIDACREAGVRVANCAGANTISVAEHTLMLALGLLKKLAIAHNSTARGEWRQMDLMPLELSGKVWGIVGMGRIGKALAERIAPFGANMLYSDPIRLASEQEKALSLAYSELPNLLKTADIISLHCPLTPETTGLISADSIALMKPSVIVVNVARGEVIDEAVVAAAIKQKKIGGLGIDVFTDEPPAPGSPLLGLGDENVILSPHVAGVTAESKMRIMSMSMNNLVKVMKGGEPENLVT